MATAATIASVTSPPPIKLEDPMVPHTVASSNAAKRVMEWFRRKSVAKYTESPPLAPSTSKHEATNVDARMREHAGAVDQNALTSRSPEDIVNEIRQVLHEMGCEFKKEGEFKVKCSRPKRKAASSSDAGRKRATSTGGTSKEGKRTSVLHMLMRTSTASTSSSVSSRHRTQFDASTSANMSIAESADTSSTLICSPIYGEAGIDNGDEVRFSVEVCKMRNLKNLYIVDIRRMRGNIWGYKFLYHTLLERLDLKSKGYMNVDSA